MRGSDGQSIEQNGAPKSLRQTLLYRFLIPVQGEDSQCIAECEGVREENGAEAAAPTTGRDGIPSEMSEELATDCAPRKRHKTSSFTQ